MRRRLAPYRRAQFRPEGRVARSHAEHSRVVVLAILACDAAAAHAAMFHHMSLVEDAFGASWAPPRARAPEAESAPRRRFTPSRPIMRRFAAPIGASAARLDALVGSGEFAARFMTASRKTGSVLAFTEAEDSP